jgi:hypothetical protein
MIISDEQVRRALDYLQTSYESRGESVNQADVGVSLEFLERVRQQIALEPEYRDERIEQARVLLSGTGPTRSEVAEKIIGRVLSDALR